MPSQHSLALPVYNYRHLSSAYSNQLEKDFLIFQSFKDNVIDIKRCPVISGRSSNRTKQLGTGTYFVHLDSYSGLRTASTRSMIISICPKSEWKNDWSSKKSDYKAIRRFCKKNDFEFSLYDESRIRHQAWANVKYVMRHIKPYGHKEDIEAVLNQVEMMGVTTLEYLLCRFFGGEFLKPQGIHTLLHLMASKRLGFDAWGELNEKTEVWHV